MLSPSTIILPTQSFVLQLLARRTIVRTQCHVLFWCWPAGPSSGAQHCMRFGELLRLGFFPTKCGTQCCTFTWLSCRSFTLHSHSNSPKMASSFRKMATAMSFLLFCSSIVSFTVLLIWLFIWLFHMQVEWSIGTSIWPELKVQTPIPFEEYGMAPRIWNGAKNTE